MSEETKDVPPSLPEAILRLRDQSEEHLDLCNCSFGSLRNGETYPIPHGAIFVLVSFETRYYRRQVFRRLCGFLKKIRRSWNPESSVIDMFQLGVMRYNDIRHRSNGYYNSLTEAHEAVIHNYGDLAEGGSNDFVMIEAVLPGVCPECYEVQWYRLHYFDNLHDGKKYRDYIYLPCQRPDYEPLDCVNFSLG